MKNKIVFIGLIVLVLFLFSSIAYAEDNSTIEDSPLEGNGEALSFENDDVLAEEVNELVIDDNNYDDYFNKYTGKFRTDVSSINTLKIGNVSSKLFTIEKPLNITSASPDCQIRNGVIHLMKGSSGSNVINITINNTLQRIVIDGIPVTQLHGIWFTNSSDNLIFNNTIIIAEEEGCYAMPMGYSSRNNILNNTISSGFTSAILMGSSNYNNISNNYIEVRNSRSMVSSNLIYFNKWGHADYMGPSDCNGTYISNNYFKGFCNSEWSYILKLSGHSFNTTIVNNTIIKGGIGIFAGKDYGDILTLENILIKDNIIINSSVGITSDAHNVLITNNRISGSSHSSGISVSYDEYDAVRFKANATVVGNSIDFENLGAGIGIKAPNTLIYNNIINIRRYGSGIIVFGDNSTIISNIINVKGDNGIDIDSNNSFISNNIINTKARGISGVILKQDFKCYNNTIYRNEIYSDDYAVYIQGYIYNTQIIDNLIQTNQSEAIFIDVSRTLVDKVDGVVIADNNINGIVKDTESIIVNDTNFYDYFDNNGYLNYSFKANAKKMIFFTFLTNKDVYLTDEIILTSNKMANLLYNVTFYLTDDASNSVIRDFKFYNFDKPSIVLDGVSDVVVEYNEFTILPNNVFDTNTILARGGCLRCNITNNDIFINSNANYTYAVSVSEPYNSINKRFSQNFTISKNNIIIKSTGVSEAIYADALTESTISDNTIFIKSDGSAYAITICNVIGRPHDIKIDSNKIVVNSQDMSYLIELFMVDNCEVANNYIEGASAGIYGVGVYSSNNISIDKNEFSVTSFNLTNSPIRDALGKGNAAIYINKSSISSIFENIFDLENCRNLAYGNSIIRNFENNYHVIASYNYELYFDLKNNLVPNIFKNDDIILFKNFTASKKMNINIPIVILPYKHLNQFGAILTLSNSSSLSGFRFVNATIRLNNISGEYIFNNSFVNSQLIDGFGVENYIFNNSFSDNSRVTFDNTLNDEFSFNNILGFNDNLNFISISNSSDLAVLNNVFNVSSKIFDLIYSQSSKNIISNNYIVFNVTGDSHVYKAVNEYNDTFLSNNIDSYGVFNSVIYYDDNSFGNVVESNKIISESLDGQDYAVSINTLFNLLNSVVNNYLVSSNGYRRGNNAVCALNEFVCNNTPVVIYVSVNASENGSGSFDSPYSSISQALSNSLNGAVIYILPGYYNESGLLVDKNITITAINEEGNTYIDACGSQLFSINSKGSLTISNLKIFNGFSVKGGSLFNNRGSLVILNSMLYNSSSYYNNSNPSFTKDKYSEIYHSFDCKDLGLGGAILNYGTLLIDSCDLFDNFGHKGGALADFGKTIIKNSLIYNNLGVHGGAIYTDGDNEFVIDNLIFVGNAALQTLDYCKISRTSDTHFKYVYSCECEGPAGHGGVIYSNSIIFINNSLFEGNIAKSGGAIAHFSYGDEYYDNSYGPRYFDMGGKWEENLKKLTCELFINNSTFRYNQAEDTSCGNSSLFSKSLSNRQYYTTNFNGGAIFGMLNNLNIKDSLFEGNIANTNGGALCVQCKNSSIVNSKFYNNTAGAIGGAIDIFGNTKMFNTEISDNSARIGGGMSYESYSYYNHVQNNANLFNMTISGNTALIRGGAFTTSVANFAITNSNIYDNSAPDGSTFSGVYNVKNDDNIDARNNWWGSVDGPDSSVRNLIRGKYKAWASDRVKWDAVIVSDSSSNDNNGGGGNNNPNPRDSQSHSISTGSGARTGSSLSGSPSYDRSGSYSFNGLWPSYSSSSDNSNGRYGFEYDGGVSYKGDSSSKTDVAGNALNPNSMSRVNSSNINNLASVGFESNAADSSFGEVSSSGEGSSSSNAYEINKTVKKDVIDSDYPLFNIFVIILLWLLLLIGFYRRYKNSENK